MRHSDVYTPSKHGNDNLNYITPPIYVASFCITPNSHAFSVSVKCRLSICPGQGAQGWLPGQGQGCTSEAWAKRDVDIMRGAKPGDQ